MTDQQAKTLLPGLLPEELQQAMTDHGLPAFRGRQILAWLYQHFAADWQAMTNLSAKLQADLSQYYDLSAMTIEAVEGHKGQARKLLGRLQDDALLEFVIIPARKRNTVCVSSQVGCKFGCRFCASGQGGFQRNLSAGEIVAQVLEAARVIGDRPENVVFMGMGEPFDNYDEVLKAVRILNHPDALNIGARRITISTCGLVPGMERLGGEGLQIELSISLHAPDDALRTQLMPVNRKYPVAELLDACRRYHERTGRLITCEYTMIHGVNDSSEQARRLRRKLQDGPFRVNLIPLSGVSEYDGQPAQPERIQTFQQILSEVGINVTVRDSKGGQIQAACGQLRQRQSGVG
jgi:23S rRNA (adenine2503-C2)-methyltransferase